MILSLLVIGGTLAFLAWLVFTFAVYALPCFVVITVATLAYRADAGVIGAGVVGLLAGVGIVILGQTVLATTRSTLVRVAILALYVVPASVAGFGVARDATAMVVPGGAWRTVFGILGAVVTMVTAFARLAATGRDRAWASPAGGSAGRPLALATPPASPIST